MRLALTLLMSLAAYFVYASTFAGSTAVLQP